jgi:hypothetical protein
MRYFLIIAAILILGTLKAQNCDAPDELFRKRHTIDGMIWGHPYTTFDRHTRYSTC